MPGLLQQPDVFSAFDSCLGVAGGAASSSAGALRTSKKSWKGGRTGRSTKSSFTFSFMQGLTGSKNDTEVAAKADTPPLVERRTNSRKP